MRWELEPVDRNWVPETLGRLLEKPGTVLVQRPSNQVEMELSLNLKNRVGLESVSYWLRKEAMRV